MVHFLLIFSALFGWFDQPKITFVSAKVANGHAGTQKDPMNVNDARKVGAKNPNATFFFLADGGEIDMVKPFPLSGKQQIYSFGGAKQLNVNGVIVRDLTGKGRATVRTSAPIEIKGENRIQGIGLDGFGSVATGVVGEGKGTFSGVHFSNFATHDLTKGAVTLEKGGEWAIEYCLFSGGGVGVVCKVGGSIGECSFDGCDYGIVCLSDGCHIEGNAFNETGTSAVVVGQEGGALISGNTISKGCSASGIQCIGGSGWQEGKLFCEVTKNTLSDVDGDGVSVQLTSSDQGKGVAYQVSVHGNPLIASKQLSIAIHNELGKPSDVALVAVEDNQLQAMTALSASNQGAGQLNLTVMNNTQHLQVATPDTVGFVLRAEEAFQGDFACHLSGNGMNEGNGILPPVGIQLIDNVAHPTFNQFRVNGSDAQSLSSANNAIGVQEMGTNAVDYQGASFLVPLPLERFVEVGN